VTGGRLLVVGGAGFVGSNLVRLLIEEGADSVLVVDNLISSERENLPGNPCVELIEGSIADDDVLASLEDEFDVVYHLATYHGNQSSIANPLEDHENNLITTLKLYERLKDFRNLKKVVYSASGCTLAPHEVYEGAEAVSEDGAVPLDLDSPYQISKVVGEFYSVYYERQHGLPTVRARFQNVYGPGEVLGAGRWRGTPATIWRNVTPTFVYRALEGLPLQLDNGGVASRDFVYVEDVARGLLACAENGTPGDVYNLASGVETTIRRLAELILDLSGSSSELEIAPRRPWDHSIMRFGSPEKARRELGFEASVAVEDGLRGTIDWTRENLGFIEGCIAKHEEQLVGNGRR
jgi:nucleoside-diphosphate-sugar epimerase